MALLNYSKGLVHRGLSVDISIDLILFIVSPYRRGRNHGIDEVAAFALDSLIKDYDQTLEMINVREATVHLTSHTLHYDMEMELTEELENTSIVCSVTVIHQIEEKNLILHSSECFKPKFSLNRDIDVLFIRYSRKKKQKPIV